MPHADNAVLHLAEALARLRRAGHLPVHITPTFKSMVEALAGQLRFRARVPAGLLGHRLGAELPRKALPESAQPFRMPLTPS